MFLAQLRTKNIGGIIMILKHLLIINEEDPWVAFMYLELIKDVALWMIWSILKYNCSLAKEQLGIKALSLKFMLLIHWLQNKEVERAAEHYNMRRHFVEIAIFSFLKFALVHSIFSSLSSYFFPNIVRAAFLTWGSSKSSQSKH